MSLIASINQLKSLEKEVSDIVTKGYDVESFLKTKTNYVKLCYTLQFTGYNVELNHYIDPSVFSDGIDYFTIVEYQSGYIKVYQFDYNQEFEAIKLTFDNTDKSITAFNGLYLYSDDSQNKIVEISKDFNINQCEFDSGLNGQNVFDEDTQLYISLKKI